MKKMTQNHLHTPNHPILIQTYGRYFNLIEHCVCHRMRFTHSCLKLTKRKKKKTLFNIKVFCFFCFLVLLQTKRNA